MFSTAYASRFDYECACGRKFIALGSAAPILHCHCGAVPLVISAELTAYLVNASSIRRKAAVPSSYGETGIYESACDHASRLCNYLDKNASGESDAVLTVASFIFSCAIAISAGLDDGQTREIFSTVLEDLRAENNKTMAALQ
ncbi:MAG: hypothetical protein WBK55_08145 [Alphaproteobacteria bacterium]